jgi:hypothetical protein
VSAGPTVDVIVNNYNYAAYVCDAVGSALRQDYDGVKVIVVDDGSTDESLQRLEAFADRIKLVTKQNGGQCSAYNAGFELARGDLVIFLDADDMLSPWAAARAAGAFAARPDASRIEFRMEVIDASGRPLGRTKPPAARTLPNGDVRQQGLAFPFDLGMAPGSGHAYNRSELERIMPIPEVGYGRWGADYYALHLTNLLGPVVAVDEVCASYRVHGNNAFEPSEPIIDLDRIHREIAYQQTTAAALLKLADELGMTHPAEILSLSNIGLRIISKKLSSGDHPVPGDRFGHLLTDAVGAARRRTNASASVRLTLLAALAAIAILPRRPAVRLSQLLLSPELRPRITQLIDRYGD